MLSPVTIFLKKQNLCLIKNTTSRLQTAAYLRCERGGNKWSFKRRSIQWRESIILYPWNNKSW